MKVHNLLMLLFAIGLLSCEQTVQPIDLVRFVNHPENGLAKTKTIGALKVELKYKPLDFLIANELRTNQIEEERYQNHYQELEGLQYYNLKLSLPQLPNQNITTYQVKNDEGLQERLYYLSFKMKEDIRLVQGTDTLAPVLYHFERSYDLAPHRTFVLAFDETNPEKTVDKTFVLDAPIFGTGPIKIKIRAEDLNDIPNIKLQ